MVSRVGAIRRSRAEGLTPEVSVTVSQWADRSRILPSKSSAEPGPWRTDRTPYLREIMDVLSVTSPVEEVVLMAAAQVGKSEVLLNFLGYVIDHVPSPVMVVQPTVETAKRFARQRIEPLIASTPRLEQRVAVARSRHASNTVLAKDFTGGQLVITGANSAAGLRSMPAAVALLDEIDAYPDDVDDEGDPIGLVEARQRTFARRKRLKVSTPTIAGHSAIESAWDESDQRRYHVSCPECGEWQPLELARLIWSARDRTVDHPAYECRACFHLIEEREKTGLLAAGRWIPGRPDRADGPIRGYHINSLYAPLGWMSWSEIAREWTRKHTDPKKLRVFVNTVLGEPWALKGDAPPHDVLYARRETYPIGTCPEPVVLLTAGIDVQKDRLVYEVVGWGRGRQSWSVDAGEMIGETASLTQGPWPHVRALLDRTFPHASGGGLTIRACAIDSGYNTQTVYEFTAGYPMSRVIAVKGHDRGSVLLGAPTPVQVLINGRPRKRGARVWPVCSRIAKTELYGQLRLERAEDGSAPPGYCHFPQYAEEFFKGLTSEQEQVSRNRRGYVVVEWEIIPGRQNHPLDARVYARAAAMLAGVDRITDREWRTLEANVTGQTTAPPRASTAGVREPSDPPVTVSEAIASAAAAAALSRPAPRREPWVRRGRDPWVRRR